MSQQMKGIGWDSLIAQIVRDNIIENHFLGLQHLPRCDASTIFSTVEKYLRDKEIKINNIKFGSMDGCPTMAGEHSGVKSFFNSSTGHFYYIHC